MNGFDYFLLAVVGVSAVLGFWRGLLSELVALCAWVLAFLAARALTASVQPYVAVLVKEPVLQVPAKRKK